MSTVSSNIRDNHTRGTVADFLREKIHDEAHLSVVSAYFTIYAYDALKESLDRIGHLDFLFGEALDAAPSGLQSARGFILPDEREQVREKADLELVTWLVIKEPDHAC